MVVFLFKIIALIGVFCDIRLDMNKKYHLGEPKWYNIIIYV